MNSIRIALAQLNFTVGDISGNCKKIISYIEKAKSQNASIVLFPELSLTGYPLEDILHRDELYKQAQKALRQILPYTKDIDVVLGLPLKRKGWTYNAAVWLRSGVILAEGYKQKLPNYSVFDECRYFNPGTEMLSVTCHHMKFSVLICEDLWHDEMVKFVKASQAHAIICLNASPYSIQKSEQRRNLLYQCSLQTGLPIFYINSVGGQDELVFDGDSQVVNAQGELCAHGGCFQESLTCVEIKQETHEIIKKTLPKQPSSLESIYQALVCGIRDYIVKNNFPGALVGLSGGIDSALTLALACDALGKDNVVAVMMPSPYSSPISLEDAEKEVKTLGVQSHIIPIHTLMETFSQQLKPLFEGLPPDVTEENIQSRIRGTLLMALSNKTGKLVLTTGNKSEMAVGYATLYGDMAGGFAPLKDMYKTRIYQLAHYLNQKQPVIPERVLTRAPSAELAPHQKDEDFLPPYSILDPILDMYIDQGRDAKDIIQAGFSSNVVYRIIALIQKSEYKRRQAAPGIRITEKAFGRDRRYPITSGYRECEADLG